MRKDDLVLGRKYRSSASPEYIYVYAHDDGTDRSLFFRFVTDPCQGVYAYIESRDLSPIEPTLDDIRTLSVGDFIQSPDRRLKARILGIAGELVFLSIWQHLGESADHPHFYKASGLDRSINDLRKDYAIFSDQQGKKVRKMTVKEVADLVGEEVEIVKG